MTNAQSFPTATGVRLHGTELPSDWVRRWTHLVQPHGQVLDLACGRGRHTHWFADHQHRVTAVDVSSAALDAIDRKLKGEKLQRIDGLVLYPTPAPGAAKV